MFALKISGGGGGGGGFPPQEVQVNKKRIY